MPARQLPKSAEQLNIAFTLAKIKNDSLPVGVEVLNPSTVLLLDDMQPDYFSKMMLRDAARSNQGVATADTVAKFNEAKKYISIFIQSFNNGVAIGMFPAAHRAYYNLDISSSSVPPLNSESDVIKWGNYLIAGDPLRVAAGGAAMVLPTIAALTVVFNDFKTANSNQSNMKDAYDAALKAVANLKLDADKLIVRIWNEVETYYSGEDITNRRKLAREWGVVYINMPDEISMEGQVTDVSGIALPDATVRLVEPDVSDDTDAYGQYSIPAVAPGTYTVEVSKEGYQTQLIPGIVITAGVVKLLNIQMISLTGNITVNVLAEGQPLEDATVDIEDLGISAQTNAGGQAFLNNVSPGTWNVQVSKIGYLPQSQPVSIVAGQTIILSFELDVA